MNFRTHQWVFVRLRSGSASRKRTRAPKASSRTQNPAADRFTASEMPFRQKHHEHPPNSSKTRGNARKKAHNQTAKVYFDPSNSSLDFEKPNHVILDEILANSEHRTRLRSHVPASDWEHLHGSKLQELQNTTKQLISGARVSLKKNLTPLGLGDVVLLDLHSTELHLVAAEPQGLASSMYTFVNSEGEILQGSKHMVKLRVPRVLSRDSIKLLNLVSLERKHPGIAPVGMPEQGRSGSESRGSHDYSAPEVSPASEHDLVVSQAQPQLLTNSNVSTYIVPDSARQTFSRYLRQISIEAFQKITTFSSKLDYMHNVLQYDQGNNLITSVQTLSVFELFKYVCDFKSTLKVMDKMKGSRDEYKAVNQHIRFPPGSGVSTTCGFSGLALPENTRENFSSSSHKVSSYIAFVIALSRSSRMWKINTQMSSKTPLSVDILPVHKGQVLSSTIEFLKQPNSIQEFADAYEHCVQDGHLLPSRFEPVVQMLRDFVAENIVNDPSMESLAGKVVRAVDDRVGKRPGPAYTAEYSRSRAYDIIMAFSDEAETNPSCWNESLGLPGTSTSRDSDSFSEYFSYMDEEFPNREVIMRQIAAKERESAPGESRSEFPEESRSKLFSNESKLSSNESKIAPDESKFSPDESKLSPDESKISPDESKLSPDESKLSPDESKISPENFVFAPVESKVSPATAVLNDFYTEDPVAQFRKSFGRTPVYCIDSATAHEIDDGISIQEQNDAYKITVHVANPTSYLKPDSILSQIAFKKGATVYMPEGPSMMLPQLMSRLCGLNGTEEKTRTIAISYTLDKKSVDGHIDGARQGQQGVDDDLAKKILDNIKDTACMQFYHVSNFPKGFTYEKVNEVLEQNKVKFQENRLEPGSHEDNLFKLFHISSILKHARVKLGQGLVLNGEKSRVAVRHETGDQESRFQKIKHGWAISAPRKGAQKTPIISIMQEVNQNNESKSQQLVSEHMIGANYAGSQYAIQNQIPFIHRTQELDLSEPARNEMMLIMQRVYAGHGELSIEETSQILSVMTSANYESARKKHESLGLEVYSNLTSPLRRYIDMVNHWNVQAHVQEPKGQYRQAGDLDFIANRLQICETITKNAVRKSETFWTGKFLERYFAMETKIPDQDRIRFAVLLRSNAKTGDVRAELVGFGAMRLKIVSDENVRSKFASGQFRIGMVLTDVQFRVVKLDCIENDLTIQLQ